VYIESGSESTSGTIAITTGAVTGSRTWKVMPHPALNLIQTCYLGPFFKKNIFEFFEKLKKCKYQLVYKLLFEVMSARPSEEEQRQEQQEQQEQEQEQQKWLLEPRWHYVLAAKNRYLDPICTHS
jgi:hypothetical protein